MLYIEDEINPNLALIVFENTSYDIITLNTQTHKVDMLCQSTFSTKMFYQQITRAEYTDKTLVIYKHNIVNVYEYMSKANRFKYITSIPFSSSESISRIVVDANLKIAFISTFEKPNQYKLYCVEINNNKEFSISLQNDKILIDTQYKTQNYDFDYNDQFIVVKTDTLIKIISFIES